jgi:hypothetical protein
MIFIMQKAPSTNCTKYETLRHPKHDTKIQVKALQNLQKNVKPLIDKI